MVRSSAKHFTQRGSDFWDFGVARVLQPEWLMKLERTTSHYSLLESMRHWASWLLLQESLFCSEDCITIGRDVINLGQVPGGSTDWGSFQRIYTKEFLSGRPPELVGDGRSRQNLLNGEYWVPVMIGLKAIRKIRSDKVSPWRPPANWSVFHSLVSMKPTSFEYRLEIFEWNSTGSKMCSRISSI